jgi:transcriptional regulator with XRE-family HTH domain
MLDNIVACVYHAGMERNGRYKTTKGLATLREQGRSVTWLARRLGVSRQYASDVLHGHYAIRRELAERIAGLLGVEADEIFAPVHQPADRVPRSRVSR